MAKVIELPANQLLKRHTLFSMFDMALYPSISLQSAMMSLNGSSVFASHLPHFKLCFFSGHKYCPECVKRDVHKIGCGIWYIEQQIPGASVCLEHRCLLTGVSNQDLSIDRQLLLPSLDKMNAKALSAELKLAQYSSDLFKLLMKEPCVEPIEIYRRRLKERGFISCGGQLRYAKIIIELQNYWQGLEFGSELGPPSILQSWEFIGPMLRKKSGYPTHIIKHLLLSAWLFNGDATKYYQKQAVVSSECINTTSVKKKYNESDILKLLKAGDTMGEVNRNTGKSMSYIRRVAELNNMIHASHPTAFSQITRDRVVQEALKGLHREDIAKDLQVGRGYVEMVISNTPGLTAQRKSIVIKLKAQKAINELRSTRANHPDWRRKEIKQQHAQAFFYLYTHHPALLELLLPAKTPPRLPPRNWCKDDLRLFEAIKELQGKENMSLSAIGRALNDRGYLRKQLQNLPMTRKLLVQLGKIKWS